MFYPLILLLFICSVSYAQDSKQQKRHAQTVTVATDEWPPFRIYQQDKTFTGFDIDLLDAISDITDLQFSVKRTPWSRALKKIEHNQVDLMTGLAYTRDRATYIHYVVFPYFTCQPAFYIQKSLKQDILTYQDLYKYKIGYVLNSAYFEPFNSDPAIERHGVVTESQLLKMAEKGRLDLFIGTDCQVDYEITKQKLWGKLKKATFQPDYNVKLYLGLSLQQKDINLSRKIGNALVELDKSGKLQKIKNKYFSAQ
ncbi:transporter substrate-binding domain-containing protein [Psychromonas sp. psych-6C06]|uniref:substrate-binding periplasmic protein n=1 Tax=Psychromonas sp. psych-6C06 TaxID=2058089 RepID=UPI00187C0F93|nr:transporter substrate-binding domain-containing protein [Psychromonas sp. psych-6C06]